MRRKPLIESIDSMDTTFGENLLDNTLYSGTSLYDLNLRFLSMCPFVLAHLFGNWHNQGLFADNSVTFV